MKYQIDDSNLDDRLAAALYQPNATYISPAVIACFITSDDWSKQSLIELKEKTDAYLLVGLQTAGSEFEDLDIIDGVIKCRLDEIEEVVKLLDVKSASTLIAIDVVDIKYLFERAKHYQFIQSRISDTFESDAERSAVDQLVSQFPKDFRAKGLLVGMESSESLSLDITTHIIEVIEKSVVIDNTDSFYCTSITDEPNSFHLKAIYAET